MKSCSNVLLVVSLENAMWSVLLILMCFTLFATYCGFSFSIFSVVLLPFVVSFFSRRVVVIKLAKICHTLFVSPATETEKSLLLKVKVTKKTQHFSFSFYSFFRLYLSEIVWFVFFFALLLMLPSLNIVSVRIKCSNSRGVFSVKIKAPNERRCKVFNVYFALGGSVC